MGTTQKPKEIIDAFLKDLTTVTQKRSLQSVEEVCNGLTEIFKVASIGDYHDANHYLKELVKEHFGLQGIDYTRFFMGTYEGKSVQLIMLTIFFEGLSHKFLHPVKEVKHPVT